MSLGQRRFQRTNLRTLQVLFRPIHVDALVTCESLSQLVRHAVTLRGLQPVQECSRCWVRLLLGAYHDRLHRGGRAAWWLCTSSWLVSHLAEVVTAFSAIGDVASPSSRGQCCFSTTVDRLDMVRQSRSPPGCTSTEIRIDGPPSVIHAGPATVHQVSIPCHQVRGQC